MATECCDERNASIMWQEFMRQWELPCVPPSSQRPQLMQVMPLIVHVISLGMGTVDQGGAGSVFEAKRPRGRGSKTHCATAQALGRVYYKAVPVCWSSGPELKETWRCYVHRGKAPGSTWGFGAMTSLTSGDEVRDEGREKGEGTARADPEGERLEDGEERGGSAALLPNAAVWSSFPELEKVAILLRRGNGKICWYFKAGSKIEYLRVHGNYLNSASLFHCT